MNIVEEHIASLNPRWFTYTEELFTTRKRKSVKLPHHSIQTFSLSIAVQFEHETNRQFCKLIIPPASVKQIVPKTTTELKRLLLSTLEHICSRECTQYCSQIHPPLSDSPLDTFEYEWFSRYVPALLGNFAFKPTNSLLSLSKMGFRRLRERKLPSLCWEIFAVNAVIDLIGPLWLLWSGITLFYHRMHLLPFDNAFH